MNNNIVEIRNPADGEVTLRPKPTSSLPQSEIDARRAQIAFNVSVVMDGYWTPKHSDQMRAAILADWCDQLEGWPADEVKDAMNEYREKNPDRRPNPGHILQVLKSSRREACAGQIEMMAAIVEEVAERRRLPAWLLRGPNRLSHVCEARGEAMSLCRDRGVTFALIGEFFGNRDTSTVIHNVQKHNEAKETQ